MSTVKQSVRNVQIVGTLQEMNFDIQTKEVKQNGKTVKCRVIMKKDFRNPSMTIDVNGDVVGVNFIPVYEINRNDGKHNPKFDGMETIINTYVPEISATPENPATRVKIDGVFDLNEYVDKEKDYTYCSFPQVVCFKPCTHTNVPAEDMAVIDLTGVVGSFSQEIVNEEETGRLNLTFYSFNKNGEVLPFNLIVPSEFANDFEKNYDIGDSCNLGFKIVSTKSSKSKASNVVFGAGSLIVNGFSKTEYVLYTGYQPYEEESTYYVEASDVKNALNIRKLMIKSAINKKKEDVSTQTSTKTTKGLGSIKSVEPTPFDDDSEDLPFDVPDDDVADLF